MSFQATVEISIDDVDQRRLDRDPAVLGEPGAVIADLGEHAGAGGIRKPPEVGDDA